MARDCGHSSCRLPRRRSRRLTGAGDGVGAAAHGAVGGDERIAYLGIEEELRCWVARVQQCWMLDKARNPVPATCM